MQSDREITATMYKGTLAQQQIKLYNSKLNPLSSFPYVVYVWMWQCFAQFENIYVLIMCF